jgi:hypothetical protein
MILGIPSILLITRTVLPSNGLLVLVGQYHRTCAERESLLR